MDSPAITPKSRPKYMDKFQLLNKSELLLYKRLTEAAPNFIVFSQVSMSQLFHIQNYRASGFRQVAEIGRKSIDFLLCRADTSIVLAIELNGPTHERKAQQARDEKKRLALEEAGIPLLIIDPADMPEVRALRDLLAPLIVGRRTAEAEKRERIADSAKTRKATDATKATDTK